MFSGKLQVAVACLEIRKPKYQPVCWGGITELSCLLSIYHHDNRSCELILVIASTGATGVTRKTLLKRSTYQARRTCSTSPPCPPSAAWQSRASTTPPENNWERQIFGPIDIGNRKNGTLDGFKQLEKIGRG